MNWGRRMAEVSRRRILQIAAMGTTASLSLGLAGCPSLPGGDLTGTVQLIADALSTIVSK
jgi:hypothetical protein